MKSEKEKMISGALYKASNKELVTERAAAKTILFDMDALRPNEAEERERLLKHLFGKTGEHFVIEPPFRCDYGYNIKIGENFYANSNLTILDCAQVTIGDHVLIGPNVGIYSAGHPIHYELRDQEYEYALPISIGDRVWIGGHVVINPGVTIGNNTVIGSGSVVTKDIPSNVIAVGNPCKVLRAITDDDRKSLE